MICSTCRHWRAEGVDKIFGWCNHVTRIAESQETDKVVVGNYAQFGANFGCIHHERKTGDGRS